jgi:hypothetical protein
MKREMLERLAANPHYQMTPKQLAELRAVQRADKPVRHDQTVPKHDTSFAKHDTKPRKDNDAESN